MKKRFTDADKWEDGWFCEQPPDVKLFWIYLCDRCDHAGVWEVNWRLAKFHLPSLDQRAIESALADKITPIKGGKAWFMPGFISFQYPIGLSTSSNAHRAIRTTMLSHGINPDNHQGTVPSRVQSTLQDKDTDQDTDTDQDMDTEKDKRAEDDSQDIFKAQGIMKADQAKPPLAFLPPKSFSDWRAMHPRAFIGKEREDWESLFKLYDYESMSDMHEKLKSPRIFYNQAAEWLSQNYTP